MRTQVKQELQFCGPPADIFITLEIVPRRGSEVVKLTTYYGLTAPQTVYRVVVNDGRVQGFLATPKAPRWFKSGSVEYELQGGNGAVKISRTEALEIISAWGGEPDELDATSWVSLPTYAPGEFAASLEPQSPAAVFEADWSSLTLAPAKATKKAPKAPRRPIEPVKLQDPFELWREEVVTMITETTIADQATTADHVTPDKHEDTLVDRPAAFSALRDLADGIGGLGSAGMGWT